MDTIRLRHLGCFTLMIPCHIVDEFYEYERDCIMSSFLYNTSNSNFCTRAPSAHLQRVWPSINACENNENKYVPTKSEYEEVCALTGSKV